MNYESQFIESQWKHAVSHVKMPAIQDSKPLYCGGMSVE